MIIGTAALIAVEFALRWCRKFGLPEQQRDFEVVYEMSKEKYVIDEHQVFLSDPPASASRSSESGRNYISNVHHVPAAELQYDVSVRSGSRVACNFARSND